METSRTLNHITGNPRQISTEPIAHDDSNQNHKQTQLNLVVPNLIGKTIKNSVYLRNKTSNLEASCNQVEEVLAGKDKTVKKFDKKKQDFEGLIVAKIIDFKLLVDEIYGLEVFDKTVGGI